MTNIKKKIEKIGVLTSGGDAPGMNAAIRAVVRYGIYLGLEVVGIEHGYQGLLEKKFVKMNLRSVSDIIQRGGTMLKSARCAEFMAAEGVERAAQNLRDAKIDGLVVIGGDGTFRGAKELSMKGIPTIGIPGTIDNDLPYTDFTLGFDTAVNTVLDAINKIRDTMNSHDRVSIIEVMGRHCGDIALYSGIGGGAEVIILPEHPISIEEVCERLQEGRASGKISGIVVLAEGAGKADSFAAEITRRTGIVIKPVVLSHLQRGGTPSNTDRMLAARWGAHAVRLLYQGTGNRLAGIKDNKIFDIDITEGLAKKKVFDRDMYNIAGVLAK